MFELVFFERNFRGQKTGKKISVKSEDGWGIAKEWNKHEPRPRKKFGRAATKAEAEKIIKQLNQE